MDQVEVDGRPIKVGRTAKAAEGSEAMKLVTAMGEEEINQRRLFVASIHGILSSDEFSSIFESFGEIKSCNLCPAAEGSADKHAGYGFLEFAEADSAKEALTLNMFNLGGLFLRVCKAVTPPDLCPWLAKAAEAAANPPTAAATAAAAKAASVASAAGLPVVVGAEGAAGVEGGGGGGTEEEAAAAAADDLEDLDGDGGNIKGSTARFLMMEKLQKKAKEQTLMVIKNMVAPDEVDESLESELMEGFGEDLAAAVDKVDIIVGSKEWVKIFVRFKHTAAMQAGIDLMDGRIFAGIEIKSHTYDQDQFEAKDYSS
jgi:poly(U)-binding-splicing factor PUF60